MMIAWRNFERIIFAKIAFKFKSVKSKAREEVEWKSESKRVIDMKEVKSFL